MGEGGGSGCRRGSGAAGAVHASEGGRRRRGCLAWVVCVRVCVCEQWMVDVGRWTGGRWICLADDHDRGGPTVYRPGEQGWGERGGDLAGGRAVGRAKGAATTTRVQARLRLKKSCSAQLAGRPAVAWGRAHASSPL